MNKSIYRQWAETKRQLNLIKDKERKLRNAIELEMRKDSDAWGTVRKEFDGLRLKSSVYLRYKVDEEAFNDVSDMLSDAELTAIDYKLSLNIAEYKKLSEDSALRKAVTVTPSAPQLSIENE